VARFESSRRRWFGPTEEQPFQRRASDRIRVVTPANIFHGTWRPSSRSGGSTAVASVGLSGALVAFDAPKAIAVAAVLTNQLVVDCLPALPGWLATTRVLHRGSI
jgi:hypothetical protein